MNDNGNGAPRPGPAAKVEPAGIIMSQANFRLLSGKPAQLFFPQDMTDDELLVLVAEMAGKLRLQARIEYAAKENPAAKLVVPPPGFRVPQQ